MENQETLTPAQLAEVNARVTEIIGTFREGLCNSAVFDYSNYWTKGLSGDGQMSDACKYVYDTKERIVEMLDKELMLVQMNDESLYYKEKRKAKEKIIDTILNFVKPYLRGESRHELNVIERIVNITEFAIQSGENLNKFYTREKHFPTERSFFNNRDGFFKSKL